MSEKEIQNLIRLGVNDIAVTFRANVGKLYTEDGRVIATGLPKGFPDLFGYRRKDGKIIFLEIKTAKGRLRQEQKQFLEQVQKDGCIAGVARSVDEARAIIQSEAGPVPENE